MLLDAGWFKALRQPNVKLVSDGVQAVVDQGIVDVQGAEHAADVIVYATGFETLNPLKGISIEGRAGHRLRDLWGDDNASAYLGMTVPNYPNFFILYGPNTNLGHGGSLIFLSECQIRYILQLIELLLDGRASEIECGSVAYRRYNDEVDERHASMVWTQPDLTNWYRNSRGRVVTNSPWKLLEYWEMTRSPDLADFSIR
jgi:4-hydroxyacetophenone monooxygenase